MRGKEGSDFSLPRRIEMMPHGGKLGRAFARIHVVVDVDGLEAPRIFGLLDCGVQVQKAVLAAASIADVDVIVGIGGIDLSLRPDHARQRRQVTDGWEVGIEAGITTVEIA